MAAPVTPVSGNNDQTPLFTAANPGIYSTGAIGGGIAWTDKTITSTSGASQTLMAANTGRKALLIKNGAATCGVNFLGTTAAIGGAGTLTLQAYEALYMTGNDCPLGAVNIICAAANYVSAFEGA